VAPDRTHPPGSPGRGDASRRAAPTPRSEDTGGTDQNQLEIRELEGMEELRAAVAFQEEIWGDGFSERVPVSLLKVSARLGGVVAGAFDRSVDPAPRLVGFVFGMTGLEEGEPIHWSDMLAVAPGYRDQGLGRRLKWYQRDAVRSLGVRRMRWTCDPLEARNLAVNLNHLGATAPEYVRDMYGQSDSPLHRGLGTDRFVIQWELDSPEVAARAAPGWRPEMKLPSGDDLPRAFPVELDAAGVPLPGPVSPAPWEADQPAAGVRVAIPAHIQALRDAAPELAALWRDRTRTALEGALSRGWIADRLIRNDGDGPICDLVLRPTTTEPPR
jgi:predicted GNAT superfamily acetyltransferase